MYMTDRERRVIMGREEKRLRERTTARLTKRLRRQPTEQEIDKEIAGLHEAQGIDPHRNLEASRTTSLKRSRNLR
jgi:hypothetical protein